MQAVVGFLRENGYDIDDHFSHALLLPQIMSDVTQILSRMQSGDPHASSELLPLVYAELRRLANARMAGQSPDHTLQATALVHEAYLRLVDVERVRRWDSRGHFFSAAADAMRCILIDNARRKQRLKHGGNLDRASPEMLDGVVSPIPDAELLALDEALEKLAQRDATAAQIVKLRFFAGLTMEEIAELLNRPLRTIEREWRYARSWLHQELSTEQTPIG